MIYASNGRYFTLQENAEAYSRMIGYVNLDISRVCKWGVVEEDGDLNSSMIEPCTYIDNVMFPLAPGIRIDEPDITPPRLVKKGVIVHFDIDMNCNFEVAEVSYISTTANPVRVISSPSVWIQYAEFKTALIVMAPNEEMLDNYINENYDALYMLSNENKEEIEYYHSIKHVGKDLFSTIRKMNWNITYLGVSFGNDEECESTDEVDDGESEEENHPIIRGAGSVFYESYTPISTQQLHLLSLRERVTQLSPVVSREAEWLGGEE